MSKINTPLDHDPFEADKTEKNIPISTYTSLMGKNTIILNMKGIKLMRILINISIR